MDQVPWIRFRGSVFLDLFDYCPNILITKTRFLYHMSAHNRVIACKTVCVLCCFPCTSRPDLSNAAL